MKGIKLALLAYGTLLLVGCSSLEMRNEKLRSVVKDQIAVLNALSKDRERLKDVIQQSPVLVSSEDDLLLTIEKLKEANAAVLKTLN